MTMPKPTFTLFCIVFALLLGGCSGKPVQRLPEPLESAKRLENLGLNAFYAGDYRSAIKAFNGALSHYRGIDDHAALARSHINVIQSALSINELEEVQTQLQELQDLLDYADLPNYRYRLLLLKSDLFIRRKDYTQAQTILSSLLDNTGISRDISNAAILNRAIIATERQDANSPEGANSLALIDQATQAIAPQSALYARLLRLKGQHAVQQGDTDLAQQSYAAALKHYRDKRYQPGIAASFKDLGELSIMQKKLSQARAQLERALRIRLSLGDRYTAKLLIDRLKWLEQQPNKQ